MVQSQAENGTSALCLRGWHILEEETWTCVLTRAGLLGCWGGWWGGSGFPCEAGSVGSDIGMQPRAAGRIPGCGWHLPEPWYHLCGWTEPPEGLERSPPELSQHPRSTSPAYLLSSSLEQEPSLGCLPEGWDPHGSGPREALDNYLSVNRVHLWRQCWQLVFADFSLHKQQGVADATKNSERSSVFTSTVILADLTAFSLPGGRCFDIKIFLLSLSTKSIGHFQAQLRIFPHVIQNR